MKKILFIIPYVPFPLNSGGNQAFFNMVEYIRHRMKVSLLLYPRSEEALACIEQLKVLWPDVTFFIFSKCTDKPVVKYSRYEKCLIKFRTWINRKIEMALLSSDKYLQNNEIVDDDQVRRHSTLFSSIHTELDRDYCRYVHKIAGDGFDLVQVEFYELISLSYWLPENVRSVFVHHEIRYIRNECEMNLFHQVTEDDHVLFRKAKGSELAALRGYEHILALTEVDCKLLSDFVGGKVHVHTSPAVVHMPEKKDRTVVPTDCRLTFVGSEDHYPNLDGVTWFCREIAPYLRRQGFNFVFQVVGVWKSDCVAELQRICPEMELVGYINDLHAFLNGSIMIVPIRIGSGMRMKILDAISSMAPFVTTEKGCEGIDLCNGIDYLSGNTILDFAEAIIRMAGDSQLQISLAEHAAEDLSKLYNPVAMLERRIAIYEQILGCKI